jgi:hypothetical protein
MPPSLVSAAFNTWLACGAILGAALLVQRRLLRMFPQFALTMTFAAVARFVVIRLVFFALVVAVTFFAVPSAAVAISLVSAFAITIYGTLVIDVLGVLRFVRIAERDKEAAIGRAHGVVRRLKRLGPTVPVANIARSLAATVLAVTGSAAAADAIVGRIAQLQFPPTQRWQVLVDLAKYRVMDGRLDDARSPLALLTGVSPTTELEESRDLFTARIEAATGAHDKALERASKHESVEWDFVRAHAHAAAGRQAEAREILGRIRSLEHGEELLRTVAERKGPAAELARAMIESGTAYRG